MHTEMKTKRCPVCNALCFDDMEVCFGCLHSFSDADTEPLQVVVKTDPDLAAAAPAGTSQAAASVDAELVAAVPADTSASEDPAAAPAETSQANRTKKTLRLDELLEIVISVRIAQDAKKAALKQSGPVE